MINCDMKIKRRFPMVVLALLGMSIHVNAQTPTTFGVGISPIGTLHVHSSARVDDEPGANIVFGSGGITDGNYQTVFHMTNTSTSTTASDGFSITQDNRIVTLRQFELAKLRIHGYNQQGLTIATNGNIGIGTDDPTSRLHVIGNASVQGTFSAGTLNAETHNVSNTFLMGTDYQSLAIGKAGSGLQNGSSYLGFNAVRSDRLGGSWNCQGDAQHNGGAVIWATMNGDLLFANIASTGGFTQLGLTDNEIKNKVNLRLGADGILYAKEVKVTVSGSDWPDYVFKEGYELRSLEKTEEYIKDNGHLPDVPSAQEIEEQGLNLGEMNRILMQKVEELTLQVIELSKQVKGLKGE